MSSPNPSKAALRALLALLALLFVFAAAVQLNDVDPWSWVVIYGGAALICGASAAGLRVPVIVAAGVGGLALAWSGYLAWVVFVSGDAQAMYPIGSLANNRISTACSPG